MRYLRAPPFLGVGGLGRRAGAPPGRSSSGRCRPLMAALDLFSDPARDWFRQAFGEPTDVQEKGWLEVAAGRHTLMSAPTGSGKTLAAFYSSLDRLAGEPVPTVDARWPRPSGRWTRWRGSWAGPTARSRSWTQAAASRSR